MTEGSERVDVTVDRKHGGPPKVGGPLQFLIRQFADRLADKICRQIGQQIVGVKPMFAGPRWKANSLTNYVGMKWTDGQQ